MVGGMNLVANPTSRIPSGEKGSKQTISGQEVSRRVISIDRLLAVTVEKLSAFEQGQQAFTRVFLKKSNEQIQAIKQINSSFVASDVAKKEEKAEEDYSKLEKKVDTESKVGDTKSSFFGGIKSAASTGTSKFKEIGTILSFLIPAVTALVTFISKNIDKIKAWLKEKIWDPITSFAKETQRLWQEEVITPLVDNIIDLGNKWDKFWKDITDGIDKFKTNMERTFEDLVYSFTSFIRKNFKFTESFLGSQEQADKKRQKQVESRSSADDRKRLESGITTSDGKVVTDETNRQFGNLMKNTLSEEDYFYKIAAKESTMGQNVIAPKGGARGIMQIMPDTAKGLIENYGGKGGELEGFGLDDRFDPEKAMKMAMVLDKENRQTLAKSLGKKVEDVSDKEARLAYFLGPEGAKKILNAREQGTNVEFSEKELSMNPNLVALNGGSGENAFKELTKGFSAENTTTSGEGSARIASLMDQWGGVSATGTQTAVAAATQAPAANKEPVVAAAEPKKKVEAPAAKQAIQPGVGRPPETNMLASVPQKTEATKQLEAPSVSSRQVQPQTIVMNQPATAPVSPSSNSSVTNNYYGEEISPAERRITNLLMSTRVC